MGSVFFKDGIHYLVRSDPTRNSIIVESNSNTFNEYHFKEIDLAIKKIMETANTDNNFHIAVRHELDLLTYTLVLDLSHIIFCLN